jgi:hypothetical protein
MVSVVETILIGRSLVTRTNRNVAPADWRAHEFSLKQW